MSSPPTPGQVTTASGGNSPDERLAAALAALGDRLRQARQASGLSNADLADRLRIGVEQLDALETADRARLPERVFVIAQARRVAGALQIDISPELEALRSSAPADSPGRGDRPSPLLRMAAAAPGSRGGTREPARSGADRRSGGRPPVVLLAGAVVLLGALWGAWQLRSSLPFGRQAGQPAAGSVASQPARPASGTAAGSATSATSPASQPAGTLPAAGSVVLASSQPSWVEVRRPNGTIVFRGLLRGARIFSLDQGLQVLAGRPDLVTVRTGKAPPQALGPISDVRWRSLPAAR